MKKHRAQVIISSSQRIFSGVILLTLLTIAAAGSGRAAIRDVGVSPWGPKDEIGRLNLITPESWAQILSRIDSRTAYDLSVEYFIAFLRMTSSSLPLLAGH